MLYVAAVVLCLLIMHHAVIVVGTAVARTIAADFLETTTYATAVLNAWRA